MQPLMCMSTTFRAPRDVIKVVDALDGKGNVLTTFNKGQISTRV